MAETISLFLKFLKFIFSYMPNNQVTAKSIHQYTKLPMAHPTNVAPTNSAAVT